MKRLSSLCLVFAVLFAVFFLLLIFLRTPFPLYPLMSNQDAIDLLTPLVLIPLYWLLFNRAANARASRNEELAFMVLASIWVLGHGMHLAANSVNNLAEGLKASGELNILDSDIYTLAYYFDEHLSHYLWHFGVIALAALVGWREWRAPAGLVTQWPATIAAGLIHGLSYFAIFLEGQTVVLGLPFALLFCLFVLGRGRAQLGQRPWLAFYFVTCLVAFVLFAGWGLYWGGFPEFTEVGWI